MTKNPEKDKKNPDKWKYLDPIERIYHHYKHLDHLLSDREWLPKNHFGEIILDLWQAIKEKGKREKYPKRRETYVNANRDFTERIIS